MLLRLLRTHPYLDYEVVYSVRKYDTYLTNGMSDKPQASPSL